LHCEDKNENKGIDLALAFKDRSTGLVPVGLENLFVVASAVADPVDGAIGAFCALCGNNFLLLSVTL
jgi:hypothetical protein